VTAVVVGALVTVSVVVPVEAVDPGPKYVPKMRSEPRGAAAELHEALPLDNVAVHSDVEPVENLTDTPGVPPVTVAE
jgi:hypothetical protein